MTCIRRTLLLLGVSSVLLGPATADAQLGDLIKRKAKEAIKGPEKEQPAATASSEDINAKMKEIYATDRNVVPITTDQLVRVEKALKFEISERDAIRKEKPPKAPEEYQACSGTAVTSAEVMKLTDDFAKANANATVDEMLKAQQKMGEQMQAILAKRCGEDPKQWEIKRDARLAEVEGRASDIAMPPGWLPPPSTGSNAPTPSSRWGSDAGDAAGDREERIEAAGVPHPFLRAYAGLKERIPPFCFTLGDDWKVQAGTSGVGVKVPHPDTGKDKSVHLYSSDEAQAMAPRCAAIMPLLRIVMGTTMYNPFQQQ